MTQNVRLKKFFASLKNRKQMVAFLDELNRLCVKYERLSRSNIINYEFDEFDHE